jgi:hypothetical protein
MKLTQRSGLEGHDSSSDGLRDREVTGVDDLNGSTTTRSVSNRLFRGVVDVRAVSSECSVWAFSGDSAGFSSSLDYIGISGRDIAEYRGVDAEVLGQDVLGGVGDPVIHHESSSIDVIRICT